MFELVYIWLLLWKTLCRVHLYRLLCVDVGGCCWFLLLSGVVCWLWVVGCRSVFPLSVPSSGLNKAPPPLYKYPWCRVPSLHEWFRQASTTGPGHVTNSPTTVQSLGKIMRGHAKIQFGCLLLVALNNEAHLLEERRGE
jgi:hypothetical protein